MLDTRALELINAGIDGELDASGEAELERLLASSDDARAVHTELQKLAAALDGMPELEPPDDLADRIIGRAMLRRRRPPPPLSRLFGSLQPLQAGLAFAAGLLLTVGAYELAQDRRSNEDVAGMVGTVVAGSQDRWARQESQLEISGPNVGGRVSLADTGNVVVLSFDVESGEETEIIVAMADSGLNFRGIAWDVSGDPGTAEYYEVSGGELRVVNGRSHPFNVYLRRADVSDARPQGIRIEVIRSGESVYQGVLETGGGSE